MCAALAQGRAQAGPEPARPWAWAGPSAAWHCIVLILRIWYILDISCYIYIYIYICFILSCCVYFGVCLLKACFSKRSCNIASVHFPERRFFPKCLPTSLAAVQAKCLESGGFAPAAHGPRWLLQAGRLVGCGDQCWADFMDETHHVVHRLSDLMKQSNRLLHTSVCLASGLAGAGLPILKFGLARFSLLKTVN